MLKLPIAIAAGRISLFFKVLTPFFKKGYVEKSPFTMAGVYRVPIDPICALFGRSKGCWIIIMYILSNRELLQSINDIYVINIFIFT